MNSVLQIHRMPPLDDPWRRMPWLVPAAIIAWLALLFAFSSVLEQAPPSAPPENAVEAQIVEIPIGGLAGGGGPGPAAPVSKPAPRVVPKPVAHPVHHKKIERPAPPIPVSPEGTLKSSSETVPAGSSSATAGSTAGSIGGSATGGGGGGEGGAGPGGGGIGTSTFGARALYAPTPQIPDDLRQDVFQAVAVAHFRVAYDGAVTVTLTKPTTNPQLNELLLNDLRQWKFFPGMKNGVAIDSEFDVRIPISVQ